MKNYSVNKYGATWKIEDESTVFDVFSKNIKYGFTLVNTKNHEKIKELEEYAVKIKLQTKGKSEVKKKHYNHMICMNFWFNDFDEREKEWEKWIQF